jgi:hypothetical protein
MIKSRRMKWEGHIARLGEERGVYRILVGKPEGKKPLGRPRCKWKYNTKEAGCGSMDWIRLTHDRDSGGHL